jgi:predicted Holliday junction resolvase-like endonuclease
MVICGSHMQKFSVSKDMEKRINNNKRRRDMVVGKVVAHLCPTLIIKELKFSIEHDRVVTTLNTIKH